MDSLDVIFSACVVLLAISSVYLAKNSQKSTVKVLAEDKMRKDFEKFLDGSKK